MNNIPIKNKKILEALNNFLWYYDNKDIVAKNLKLHGKAEDRQYFVSDEYRDKIIHMDEKHDGFPECGHNWGLKCDDHQVLEGHDTERVELMEKFNNLDEQLCSLLCTRNNALAAMYPPGGYLSWHNNANASAYNLIFTWSETSEGNFTYVDGHTGKNVVMQDVKGWQCKAGYFGAYGEPWYNRVYHAAETDCYRMTISYIFDRSDMSLGLQDDVIEEIMSDY